MGKLKTIPGALHRIPNLEHNNRDHWPPNAKHTREDRNIYYVKGTKDFTIEQAYDKLFEVSYQEWRQKEIKKSRGDRCPNTYYEKILQDKQKHEQYEIIWQIGDIEDTGYENAFDDAICAEEVLLDFAEHILFDVGNVTFLTKERMNNPDWERAVERAKEAEKKVLLVEANLKMKEKAVTEKASTIFKLDEMLTDKKKNLEQVDDTVRYYERKLDSAKEKLAVAEDDYKAVADKLEEKSRKAEIAEEVYFMCSGAGSDKAHNLFEEVVQLRYENERKDGEIRKAEVE